MASSMIMRTQNILAVVFGVALLATGLAASFYEKTINDYGEIISRGYPFQTIGIILALAGIIFVGFGLLISRKNP